VVRDRLYPARRYELGIEDRMTLVVDEPVAATATLPSTTVRD